MLLWIGLNTSCWAQQDPRELVQEGNQYYQQEKFNEAVNQYDRALIDDPQAYTATFNKANCFFRLDDLNKALDLYQQVAAKTKDMSLVTKAKYNLGNTYFQKGLKQRDSDLKKAMTDLETAIAQWRSVLDTDADHNKAARNIEVARLIIKDIIDQLNKQQDPNQPQNQSSSSSRQEQGQNQQQADQGQDPNQPQDPNQGQQDEQKDTGQDPNASAAEDEQQVPQQAQDMTAQEILDKEQRRKKERQTLQRIRSRPVDKDW